MGEQHELAERMRRARLQLAAIPGVARIGFGLKEAGGEVTDIQALRVYVPYKRARADLDLGERVPAFVEGFATDVITGTMIGGCSSRGTVRCGDKIIRDNPGDDYPGGGGTAGMFVLKGTRRLLLSNFHVLFASIDTDSNRDIYSPKISCHRPFGHYPDVKDLEGKKEVVTYPIAGTPTKFWVDAQLADVVDGATVDNTIPGIGPLAAINDITPTLAGSLGMHLRKRGMTTGITGGKLVDLYGSIPALNNGMTPPEPYVDLVVRCNDNESFAYDQTFEVQPGQNIDLIKKTFDALQLPITAQFKDNDATVRVFGKVGGMPGDSGAIWVDDARNVVALNYANLGVPITVKIPGFGFQEITFGRQVACAIVPVFVALGLGTMPAFIPPAAPSAGERLDAPHDPWPDERYLHELEARLATTEGGRRLIGLGRRHYPELAELVHHRRRVTVAWHRHHGPSFSASLLRSLADGAGTLPRELAGVTLTSALLVMRDVLSMEAGAGLRDDLAAHGDWILDVADHAASIDTLVAYLGAS